MEKSSKKITKTNQFTSHGRSKFDLEQGKFIADHIKGLIEKGHMLYLKDIRRLMLSLSKKFIEQRNEGKIVEKLGTTTIYTFLERNGIPAPHKAKRIYSEGKKAKPSAVSIGLKPSGKKNIDELGSGQGTTGSSTSIDKATDEKDEIKNLEAELFKHKKAVLEIEARLLEIKGLKRNKDNFDNLINYESEVESVRDDDFLDLEKKYEI